MFFTESGQSLNHFPTFVVETYKDCTDCTSEFGALNCAVSFGNIFLQSTGGKLCCGKSGLEEHLLLFLATRERVCQYALVEYDLPVELATSEGGIVLSLYVQALLVILYDTHGRRLWLDQRLKNGGLLKVHTHISIVY